MKLWVAVTQDEYELPVAVADTARELAEMLGVKTMTVVSDVSRYRRKHIKTRFRCVEVEDDGDIQPVKRRKAPQKPF